MTKSEKIKTIQEIAKMVLLNKQGFITVFINEESFRIMKIEISNHLIEFTSPLFLHSFFELKDIKNIKIVK